MAADEQEEYHQVNEYYEKDTGLEGLQHEFASMEIDQMKHDLN
jgi:hypothetical protein